MEKALECGNVLLVEVVEDQAADGFHVLGGRALAVVAGLIARLGWRLRIKLESKREAKDIDDGGALRIVEEEQGRVI